MEDPWLGGYDLSLSAEHLMGNQGVGLGVGPTGTVLDPVVQMTNHTPGRVWDPMVDYTVMSRFNKGFSSRTALVSWAVTACR